MSIKILFFCFCFSQPLKYEKKERKGERKREKEREKGRKETFVACGYYLKKKKKRVVG